MDPLCHGTRAGTATVLDIQIAIYFQTTGDAPPEWND